MSLRETYTRKDWGFISAEVDPGVIAWTSPSNIALVKYWGKYGDQLPSNPSLSFTLERAHTETKLAYEVRKRSDVRQELEFEFEGEQNPAFEKRIRAYLKSIEDIYPFLGKLHLRIESKNSFPHSSGIASSASGLSALALCLCSLEDELFDSLDSDEEYDRKASFLARLASGSACRSIYPKAALWGKTPEIEGSSDEYAVPVDRLLHKRFQSYKDSILIVSARKKSISSSEGHTLMRDHPFAEQRFAQARRRVRELINALGTGDLEKFIEITEDEALTLHGLMMSSSSSYLLMEPNTLAIIRSVREFRRETGLPLCFTLDAGPNVHLLYPSENSDPIQEFIKEELLNYCENKAWIDDNMGEGPVQTQ